MIQTTSKYPPRNPFLRSDSWPETASPLAPTARSQGLLGTSGSLHGTPQVATTDVRIQRTEGGGDNPNLLTPTFTACFIENSFLGPLCCTLAKGDLEGPLRQQDSLRAGLHN